MTPHIAYQRPADIHSRTECCVKIRGAQAGEAQEPTVLDSLDSPQPEAVLLETRLGFIDQHVTLAVREGRQAVLHHLRIGADPGERLAVRIRPATEQQSLGVQRGFLHWYLN